MINMEKYYFATGRRKSAIAQVRLSKGSGRFELKGRTNLEEPFIELVSVPFKIVGREKEFDVSIILRGGGKSSQIEATRLGGARALIKVDQECEKALKKEGMLTRDPREKERKKPGLKRARKAPQWAKR